MTINSSRVLVYVKLNIPEEYGNIIETNAFWLYVVQCRRWSWVSIVKQRLLTPYPSWVHEFTPGFMWGSFYSIFSSICMLCRSLFVLLYFFFWSLCPLFFVDIRILITPLVSSSSSYVTVHGNLDGMKHQFKKTKKNSSRQINL